METKCAPSVSCVISWAPGLVAKRGLSVGVIRTVCLVTFEDDRGCDFTERWLEGGEASPRKPNEPLWEGECL